MDAISTFRITCGMFMGGRIALEGLTTAPVVHAIYVSILEHRDIPARVTLPRGVEYQGNFSGDRLMQTQFDGVCRFDKQSVGKKFPMRSNIDRHRKQSKCQSKCAYHVNSSCAGQCWRTYKTQFFLRVWPSITHRKIAVIRS